MTFLLQKTSFFKQHLYEQKPMNHLYDHKPYEYLHTLLQLCLCGRSTIQLPVYIVTIETY